MARNLGPTSQKILLLLMSGVALGLTRSPRQYFRIIETTHKAWQELDRKQLKEAINNLYKSRLVDMRENQNGTIEMVLTEKGKKKILSYDFEKMEISKPKVWDKKWRIITFDVPEKLKRVREALRDKLKDLGFEKYQKSIFIHPYECKDEIDFVIEFFELRPYVRYLKVEAIDNELDFKKRFQLLQ